MRIQTRVIITALCVGASIFGPTFAFAQDANGRYVLRIDGGKLGKVVDDVHEQTNLEFLYSFDLVNAEGIKSVHGKYTLDEALTIMFEGTGLSGGLTGSGMIVITREISVQTLTQGEDEMISKNVKNSLLAGVSALVIGGIQTTAIAQETIGDVANIVENTQIGQTGTIEGRVTYADTNKPLIGAIVDLENTNLSATTNRRGEYRFSVAPVGTHTISIDYLGLENKASIVSVRRNSKSVQNFSLGRVLDEIVVSSQRSSLMQSLNQQRAADNVSTVVSSDLLGSFPAENIAEALRRVSGVTFSRDASSGEGTKISVRGFNEEAINIQLNGIELNGTGIDRSVDLTGFLTENISQVTIHKSLLPSHEATGSGGLVEIETKSGLDYGDKYLSFGFEREGGFAGGFGKEVQANVTGAYKFTDTFGVVASLQYRDTDRDNFDIGFLASNTPVLPAGFTSLFRVPESFNYPFDGALSDRLLTGVNYFSRHREEKNLTGSVNFALDVSDHTILRLDMQRVNSQSTQTASRASQSFLSSSTDMPISELGGEVRRRTYIKSLRPGLGLIDTETDLNLTSISLRGETNLDKWDFNYKAGYSKVVRDRVSNSLTFSSSINTDIFPFIDPTTVLTTPDDAANTLRVVGGVVGSVGDNISFLNLTQAGRDYIGDPSTYNLVIASLSDARDPTESFSGELKTRRNFNHNRIEYIEVGGKYKDVSRENSDDVLSSTNITTRQSLIRIFGRDTSLATLLPTGLVGTNFSLIGADNLVVPMLGAGTANDVFANALALTVDDPNTPDNEERFRLSERDGDPIQNSGAISPSKITEETIAAYVQTKLNFGDLSVVGGVRYERNKRNGNAIFAPSIRLADGSRVARDTLIDLGLVTFKDTGGVDATWTPSVQATYRPNEQFVVRAGYNRSTTNPNIKLIAGNPQIILDLRTTTSFGPSARLREPNPNLVPSVADNFEIDFSHYFQGNPGLLRAGFFYKTISNNFTSVLLSDEATGAELRTRILEDLAPFDNANPGLLVFPDDTQYFLNRPQNGDGGEIYGFELEVIRQLDFLPKSMPTFVENFSVVGNLTYTTSSFETLETARNDAGESITLSLDRPFAGQSRWAGNASLRYEEGPFSGSVIYTYQSASAIDYDEFNLNRITPKFSTLDARVSYTIEDGPGGSNILLFAEADNLLKGAKDADVRNGIGSQFGDGNTDFFFPGTLQFNGGRTFTVGAKVRF